MIHTTQLDIELEKVKQYIDNLDDREKRLLLGWFKLELKSVRIAKELCRNLRSGR